MINNFDRKFKKIKKRAGVKGRRFHDFGNTALTNWLTNGMSEHDVMKLAGHSSFATTHQFYLAVSSDLVDRARAAVCQNLVHIWYATVFSEK